MMPDAEELLVAFLADEFPPVKVVTELYMGFEQDVPLLRIARIGGAQVHRLVLDGPRLDIDVYNSTRAGASQLAREVAAIMPTAKGREYAGGLVTSVQEEVGPSWRPEYNPQLYHFGCTYVLTIRPTH
jgi:hypothetical protein